MVSGNPAVTSAHQYIKTKCLYQNKSGKNGNESGQNFIKLELGGEAGRAEPSPEDPRPAVSSNLKQ